MNHVKFCDISHTDTNVHGGFAVHKDTFAPQRLHSLLQKVRCARCRKISRELNKALQREHFTLPVLEDAIHELGESRVFTKADLASGYWHIELDEESSRLTTFQTCHGRYRWRRLPFGLNVKKKGKGILFYVDIRTGTNAQ